LLSNEKQVRADTPPCFIWHTWDDAAVPVENSLQFAEVLRAKKISCDLHLYQHGSHGMGLGKSSAEPKRLHPWTDDLLYWLGERGLLEK
jgi:dipeptidyl aminopeptidase/acylaminoacyl peptidase